MEEIYMTPAQRADYLQGKPVVITKDLYDYYVTTVKKEYEQWDKYKLPNMAPSDE